MGVVHMRWQGFGGVWVVALVAAISLSGCGLGDRSSAGKADDRLGWLLTGQASRSANRSAIGKEEEQSADKGQAPPAVKEQATAAAGAPPKGDAPEVKAGGKEGEKPLSESQKELEERIVRSPGRVSGDYFRQREPPGAFNLNLGRLFGPSEDDEQKRKSLEERIAKIEAQLAARAAPQEGPAAKTSRVKAMVTDRRGPVNRVAMVAFEPEAPDPKGFGRIPLEVVASALEKEPRLVVVEQPLVDRVLQDQRIRPTAENAKQVATLLERDLGTQLVIFLHEAGVSADWDRRGQMHAEVILNGEIHEGVTGEAFSLLSAKGTQAASGSQEAVARAEALKQATDQLSAAILKKALDYEWSARVLSVEDGRVRLNAGRRSGLREGDLLRVFRSHGQQVYHPTTKLLVGLDLGDPKGKIQVTDFFGADAAIAKITEGSGFAPNDLLKLEKR